MNRTYRKLGDPLALGSLTRLGAKHKQFLLTKPSWTLHRPRRKNFPRNYYKVLGIGQVFEVDLCDLVRLQKFNDNYRYLLCGIDVFSKKLFAEPLKNKTTELVSIAMEKIIRKFKPYIIDQLQSDAGKEFTGASFQKLMKKHNIRYRVVTNPDQKAAVIERALRSLKLLIYRYRTEFNTNRYIHVLPKILQTYNSRIHSTIKHAPNDVNYKNEQKILNIYKTKWNKYKRQAPKLKIDDLVRVRKAKDVFDKEHDTTFTKEVFKIAHVNTSMPLPMYSLKDLNGSYIKGQYVPAELQELKMDLEKEKFEIEKILKRKKNMVYVSWKGYPSSFNSWIPSSNIKAI